MFIKEKKLTLNYQGSRLYSFWEFLQVYLFFFVPFSPVTEKRKWLNLEKGKVEASTKLKYLEVEVHDAYIPCL